MTPRWLARALASTAPAAWVADVVERAVSDGQTCAVLTYHRVVDPDDRPDVYPGLCVRPSELEAQLRALDRRSTIIDVGQLLANRRSGARLPRRSVLLTFDDAYGDFASAAWPILRSMGLPAVLFVPTDYPDRPGRSFWWDRLYDLLLRAAPRGTVESPLGTLPVRDAAERMTAFRRLRAFAKSAGEEAIDAYLAELAAGADAPPRGEVLGWDDLGRLLGEGVSLASHARSHRLLTRLPDEALRDELVGARAELEERTGVACPLIAYPSGDSDDRVRAMAEAAGYEVGFTTQRGVNRFDRMDWLGLRRINVGLASPPELVRTQVAILAATASRG